MTEQRVINLCTRCGRDAEPTPAVMASGGDHPSCHFRGMRGALTASGAPAASVLALELWHARRRLREFTTRRGGWR